MAVSVRIVLQARMSSSRLPAKVLLPMRGMPLVELCARRLANLGADLVVATSDNTEDDVLVSQLEAARIKVHRGSLDDVLGRFAGATGDLADEDIVVRCTADNPVPDGTFIAAALEEYRRADCDYLGTDSPRDGLAYGVSAEVIRVSDLRAATQTADDPADREHVTPWIKRHRTTALLDSRVLKVPNRAHLRCTVDTYDDYQRMAQTFSRVRGDPVKVPWTALVEALQEHANAPAFRVPFAIHDNAAMGVMALGTAQLGTKYGIANRSGCPDARTAIDIVKRAVDHGITWIDTARAYGSSEARIGEALRGGWERRVRVITKLNPLMEMPNSANADWVKASTEASISTSLASLRKSSLDILMLHRWEHYTAFNGAIWGQLLRYRDMGMIDRLGASLYTPTDLREALLNPDIKHIQIPFNILDHRWLSEELIAAIKSRPDVGIHVRSVFLQGLLAAADATLWPSWDSGGSARLDRIRHLARACERESVADLCIAFVRSFPWVTSLVLGMETLKQLNINLGLVAKSPLTPSQAEEVLEALGGAPARLIDPSLW